jgi:hypothetical protein
MKLILKKIWKNKKLITLVMYFIFIGSTICGADSVMGKVAGLIKGGLFENETNILNESGNLKELEKRMLYDDFKKDNILPFALNFLIGAGLGSFIQGDTDGGIIAVVGDGIGLGLFTIGYVGIYSSIYSGSISSASTLMVTSGSIIMLGTRIFECIRPFAYASKYNTTLKNSIRYYENSSIGLISEIKGNKFAMGFNLSIELN